MAKRLAGVLLANMLFAAGLTASATMAQASSDIKQIQRDLSDTLKELSQKEENSKKIAAEEKKLRSELEALQKEAVTIAGRIQKLERNLNANEQKLDELEKQQKTHQLALDAKKKDLAMLLQSMTRFSRIPPELVIAQPTDMETTLRTAKILGLTSASLADEAKKIETDILEIDRLSQDILARQETLSTQKSELAEEKKTLDAKVAERNRIHQQLSKKAESEKNALAKLSRESHSLRDLLSQLERKRKADEERARKLAVEPRPKPSTASPKDLKRESSPKSKAGAPTKGKMSLPAAGKLFILYGDKTKQGDMSRGIALRTRENAQVVATATGEIVYTGDFLNYGKMVIIRHGEAYHSLLAGFSRITARVGQKVVKGEPIGEMGKGTKGTELYLELRENNRPIDPQPWLENR